MNLKPLTISLPVADRRKSHDFYRDALGLVVFGEPDEDGLPEPLQFIVNEGLRLMLIPTVGFGWVIGGNKVVESGSSELIFSIEAASISEVGEIIQRADNAGGRIVVEPARQDWGYTGSFADPDGHIWMVAYLGKR